MSAIRSFAIVFQNDTDQTLTLLDSGLSHGVWSNQYQNHPPKKIVPGAIAGWGSEKEGFGTGTEGYAKYRIGDTSKALMVKWDNPFAGSNRNSVKCPSAYTARCSGGSGLIACLTVVLARTS